MNCGVTFVRRERVYVSMKEYQNSHPDTIHHFPSFKQETIHDANLQRKKNSYGVLGQTKEINCKYQVLKG